MPRQKALSEEMQKVFDASYAKRQSRDYDLKITLRKNYKGVSLFSTKPIKKGNIIAYYKFMVYKYVKGFQGKKRDMYTMSVYTKSGRLNPYLMGDIYEGSLREPKNGIAFWAYFSNEPSGDQRENAMLDINERGNYRNRSRVKPGDTMTYKLLALRDIDPGEEIIWCYGDAYFRTYKSNC